MTTLQWMEEELRRSAADGRLRTLRSTTLAHSGWLERDGLRMLNLASNLYLGLPDKEEGEETQPISAPVGAGASRLVVGGFPALERFEDDFASFKGTESCLVFGSGYAANVGAIQAIADRDSIVFSDKLNHASITDGIVLSRSDHKRYKHRDMDHLEMLLKRASVSSRKLIVTDAVFSMDGTVAPLRELVQLKERYGAMLMVDEAHSGGVYGREGQGLVHELGLTADIEVIMGTFSKAYGSYGAYVAGSGVLKRYLVNRARSVIYSTALPPSVVDATRRNWEQARAEGWRRERLRRNAARFRADLAAAGFHLFGAGDSPIVPLVAGDNERAVRLGEELQAEGICAIAIRPPTVPDGTARIRFSLMATHTAADLDWAAETIASVGRRLGVI